MALSQVAMPHGTQCMNRLSAGLAMILMANCIAHAREAANDERDLLQAEAALCHAFEVGDAVAAARGLDARFTLTDSRGHVTDRAQNLDEIAKREPYYEVFRNRDGKVRVYGDAAVVTGITRVKGHSGNNEFDVDFSYTDTWIRRNGAWLLVASHASKRQD
jgi:hypothetical protein